MYKIFVIGSANAQHNDAFLKIHYFVSVSSMYVKLCFVDSKRNNTLALYVFLWQLKLYAFHYTVITYGYFNAWSRDKTIQLSMK